MVNQLPSTSTLRPSRLADLAATSGPTMLHCRNATQLQDAVFHLAHKGSLHACGKSPTTTSPRIGTSPPCSVNVSFSGGSDSTPPPSGYPRTSFVAVMAIPSLHPCEPVSRHNPVDALLLLHEDTDCCVRVDLQQIVNHHRSAHGKMGSAPHPLAPLLHLLADPSIVKVIHDGRGFGDAVAHDRAVFDEVSVEPIVDTCLLPMFFGYMDSYTPRAQRGVVKVPSLSAALRYFHLPGLAVPPHTLPENGFPNGSTRVPNTPSLEGEGHGGQKRSPRERRASRSSPDSTPELAATLATSGSACPSSINSTEMVPAKARATFSPPPPLPPLVASLNPSAPARSQSSVPMVSEYQYCHLSALQLIFTSQITPEGILSRSLTPSAIAARDQAASTKERPLCCAPAAAESVKCGNASEMVDEVAAASSLSADTNHLDAPKAEGAEEVIQRAMDYIIAASMRHFNILAGYRYQQPPDEPVIISTREACSAASAAHLRELLSHQTPSYLPYGVLAPLGCTTKLVPLTHISAHGDNKLALDSVAAEVASLRIHRALLAQVVASASPSDVGAPLGNDIRAIDAALAFAEGALGVSAQESDPRRLVISCRNTMLPRPPPDYQHPVIPSPTPWKLAISPIEEWRLPKRRATTSKGSPKVLLKTPTAKKPKSVLIPSLVRYCHGCYLPYEHFPRAVNAVAGFGLDAIRDRIVALCPGCKERSLPCEAFQSGACPRACGCCATNITSHFDADSTATCWPSCDYHHVSQPLNCARSEGGNAGTPGIVGLKSSGNKGVLAPGRPSSRGCVRPPPPFPLVTRSELTIIIAKAREEGNMQPRTPSPLTRARLQAHQDQTTLSLKHDQSQKQHSSTASATSHVPSCAALRAILQSQPPITSDGADFVSEIVAAVNQSDIDGINDGIAGIVTKGSQLKDDGGLVAEAEGGGGGGVSECGGYPFTDGTGTATSSEALKRRKRRGKGHKLLGRQSEVTTPEGEIHVAHPNTTTGFATDVPPLVPTNFLPVAAAPTTTTEEVVSTLILAEMLPPPPEVPRELKKSCKSSSSCVSSGKAMDEGRRRRRRVQQAHKTAMEAIEAGRGIPPSCIAILNAHGRLRMVGDVWSLEELNRLAKDEGLMA